MPQYWLKPLGVTTPPSPMPNDWTVDANLDSYSLRTGPNTPRQPPQMGPGDRIIFHGVIHARVFAEGEILDIPRWKRDPVWDLRWPWVYPCRIDMWVPLIEDGPRTSDVAPRRAMGRIQAGGDFAPLSREEYNAVVDALSGRRTVVRRAANDQITRG